MNSAIRWMSRLKAFVALSTIEAKYSVAIDVWKEAICIIGYLKNLV